MKNVTLGILFALSELCALSCFPQPGYKISGELSGFQDSSNIYLINRDLDKIMDSALLLNSKFEFTGHIESLSKLRITIKHPNKNRWLKNDFWMENRTIDFKAGLKNFSDVKLIGSEIQIQEDKLNNMLDSINIVRTIVIKRLREAEPIINKIQYDSLTEVFNNIEQKTIQIKKSFISNHPEWEYSSYILYNLIKHFNISKKESLEAFNNLTTQVRETKYGLLLKNYLFLSTDFQIGDKYKSFTLPDINDIPVNLSEINDKYILLHFWASSCSHSRAANITLAKIHKEYKVRGLEIVAISMDTNKEDWQKTIKTDSIDWITVSDLKGYNGPVAMTYRIDGVPQYFLINPEGTIIDKGMFDNKQLSDKLVGIFKK